MPRKGEGTCQYLTGIKEHTGHIIILGCLSVISSGNNRIEAIELAVLLLNTILCVDAKYYINK
jgi:hypothetical protein